jgi:hypothetical protein
MRRYRPLSNASALLIALLLSIAFVLGSRQSVVRAQSQGILVVGATSVSPLALTHGCNAIIIQSADGTPVAAIAALVSPAAALQSIWRYNNTAGLYQVGYFADRNAPVTFSATGAGRAGTATESYFLCVNQAATIVSI